MPSKPSWSLGGSRPVVSAACSDRTNGGQMTEGASRLIGAHRDGG